MKERPEYKPRLREENDEGLKRRELLQTAIGGVFLGILSGADSLEAKSRPRTLDDIFFRSIQEKIEFENAQDLSGGHVKAVLNLVQELQDKILNLQNDLSSFSSEAVLMMKQKSWSQFKTIPEVRPFFRDQFSEREFDAFMLHELPRYFARYGVFTRITNAPIFHKKQKDLLANMYLLDTYEVAHRDTWTSSNLWGKTAQFQKLILARRISSRGASEKAFTTFIKEDERESGGQAIFGNIIHYPGLENSYHKDKKLRAEIQNTFSSRIPFDRLEFQNLPDAAKITEEEALTFSYLKTSWNVGKAAEEMTLEQYLHRRRENIDVHEATHLQDDQDESFQTAFPRQPVSTMEEYLKHLMNYSTHSEINGLLSEMRYGKHKDFAFFTALLVPALDTGARIHHPAARWILDQMVTEIQRNPHEYGFILHTTDALTRKKEIMGTLYRLPSRIHIMEMLMDKIKRIHSDRLTKDDFSSLFLRSHDFDRSLLSTEEKLGILAAGTLLAGGIGYGIKKFLERRGRFLQAEEERKKMPRAQKKRRRRR